MSVTSSPPETTTTTERVNVEIRVVMARRDITPVTLAESAGIPYPQLWRRLKGRVAWNVEELTEVAAALGLDDVRDLFR